MKVYNGIGPFKVESNGEFSLNPNRITKEFHLLAIDFPCNIGFLNDTSFRCPPIPPGQGRVAPNLNDLAATIKEGLRDFFSTTNPDCYLKNLLSLKIYLWSEQMASQLAISLKLLLDQDTDDKKITVAGVLLGDPMIDLVRQNQNFAAYGVSRNSITNDVYRYFLGLENNIQLMKVGSVSLCLTFYSKLFMKFDMSKMCPYDLTTGCPNLNNYVASPASCDMYGYDSWEVDPDNAVLKLMSDQMKILKYAIGPGMVMNNITSPSFVEIYDESAVSKLAAVANSPSGNRLLLYQSQNNFFANTISLMLFSDTLRWSGYEQFIQSKTVNRVVNSEVLGMKYTSRCYNNYCRSQVFGTGGLYTYRNIPTILRDYLFKDFCI